MSRKRLLITGGAGAIGAVLTRRLVSKHSVTVIDNLSSGHLANLQAVDACFEHIDIRDEDKLNKIFKTNFDVVVHLAAHFANQNSVEYPSTDLSVNVVGTLNILKHCAAGKSRFVYASSSCVYGGNEPPFKEEMPINDLHTPYAVSKYSGELYTDYFIRNEGLEGISLRFFNNFGPYDPSGQYRNVLPNFIHKAMNNEDIVITGTGNETRDFNYCENTVDGILAACFVNYDDLPAHKSFNIGSGEEWSIKDLAERIIRLTNSKSSIKYIGRRGWDHTSRRYADISKAKEYLGYEPAVGFLEGLEQTVAWCKGQNGS